MRNISRKFYLALGLMLGVTLFVVVYASSPALSQQGSFFADMFIMNAYDWTPTNGSWSVVDGEYTEIIDPASEETWSVAGSTSWFDYTVETKVRSTDKNGSISLAGRWADINNYYALEYKDSGTPESARLTLYKKVNGFRVDLKEWKRVSDLGVLDPRIPYIGEGAADVVDNPYPVVLKLKFNGANIQVYVNDNRLDSGLADTSLFYGKIALGEVNRKAFFDDVYVWDVTPPVLSTIALPYKVGNAASLEFTTNEYASHRIDYGLTNAYGLSKVKTLRELKHSIDLTDLTPSTQYYYQVTVTDAAGNSATRSGDFTTEATPDLVPPVVSDVVYSEITSTTAMVSWQSDEPGNSIIDYGISSGAYKWSLSYDDKNEAHEMILTRLTGDTKYYFKVKTRDVAGNLTVSPEYSFETLKDFKPKITKVLTGSSPTTNLTVSWAGISAALRYKVYVSLDNNWNATPDVVIDETGESQYSYQKFGLNAFSNYYIKVQAEDDVDSAYTVARAFPPDTNPHGYYWDNPELCQNCHAAHTADGARLILEVNQDRLCITCHDGSQSKYDVLRGKFKGVDSADHADDPSHATWYNSIAGPYGNLENMTVEPEYTPTSRHDLDIFHYAATGNNIENIEVADTHLSCSSCHDPHGSDNYRNLRANMRVSLNPETPLIKSEAYAVTEATSEKTIYVSGAVDFCGACHSDFNQGAGASRTAAITTAQPGMKLSTASLYKYMHPVNISAQYVATDVNGEVYNIPVPTHLPLENGKIICQTCHYTHGTLATGTHIRRDGFQSTSLKRFNETTGCEDCHDKTNYPD